MSKLNDAVIAQFIAQVKLTGMRLPKDSLEHSGLRSRNKTIYRIGTRSLCDCFLLQRGGHYSVYAAQTYGRYADAFRQAIGVDTSNRQIDHFYPKAPARIEAGLHGTGPPDGLIFLLLGAVFTRCERDRVATYGSGPDDQQGERRSNAQGRAVVRGVAGL